MVGEAGGVSPVPVTTPAVVDAGLTAEQVKALPTQQLMQKLATIKTLDAPDAKVMLDGLKTRDKAELQTAQDALVKDPATYLKANGSLDPARVKDLATRLSQVTGVAIPPTAWQDQGRSKPSGAPQGAISPADQANIDRTKAAAADAKKAGPRADLNDDQKKVLHETRHLLSHTKGTNGASEAEIKELQDKLGMPKEKQTGKYDAETIAAVRKFQTDNKLHLDGDVGQETWSALLFKDAKPPKWGADMLSQTPAAADPPPADPAAATKPPAGQPPADPAAATKPPAGQPPADPAAATKPPAGQPPADPAAATKPPAAAAPAAPPPDKNAQRTAVLKLAQDVRAAQYNEIPPDKAKAISESAGKVLAALNDGTINTSDLMPLGLSRMGLENIQDKANAVTSKADIAQQKKAIDLDKNLSALKSGWLAPDDAKKFQAAVKDAISNGQLSWGPPGMSGRGVGITEADMDKMVQSAPADFAKNELKLINKDLDSGKRDDAAKELDRLRKTPGIDLKSIDAQLQDIDGHTVMNGLQDRIAQLGEGKLTYPQAKQLEADIGAAQAKYGKFEWGYPNLFSSGWKFLKTTQDSFQTQITQQGLKDLAAGKMSKADAQQFAAVAKYALAENPDSFYDVKVNGNPITASDVDALVAAAK